MEGLIKFQKKERQAFSDTQITGSENTIGEIVQQQRYQLAAKLQATRAERDDNRRDSERLAAKVRNILGMQKSSTNLSRKADYLNQEAKQELDRGKYSLKINEEEMINDVVKERVTGPLGELSSAESSEDADTALFDFDFETMIIALGSHEHRKKIGKLLDHIIKYAKKEADPQLAGVISQLIEQNFIAGDWEEAFRYINAGRFIHNSGLFASLSQEQKMNFIKNFEAHPDILSTSMERNYSLTKFCFENGSEISEEVFDQMLDEVGSREDPYSYGEVVQLYLNSSKEGLVYQQTIEHLDKYLLNQFGVRFDEIADVWTFGVGERDISLNLRKMKIIESELEGGVRKLIDNYGIKEFQRYPAQVLIKQLQEENVQQPYGIVMFPRSDHNGSFDMKSESIQHLYDSTRGKHALKIFEVGSMWEVVRHLTKLNETYGQEHKIDFAVFGGHGNTSGIDIGRWGKSSAFYTNDAEKDSVARAKKFFVNSPEIVMVSCSTGAPNGIAQAISKSLEARVVAPEKISSLIDLEAIYDENGKISIKVEYSVEKNRYSAGLPVSENQDSL